MALENAVERMKELQDAAAAAQDGPKENGD